MTKKLTILVTSSLLLFALVYIFRLENIGTTALWNLSEGGTWLLPLVAVAALIDSINPCAFSILLLTVAFLLSIGKLRSSVLSIGSAYIFGIFLVYLLIGLGLLQTLHIFDTPHFMAKVGASLLLLLGAINIANELFPNFPVKLAIPHVAHHKIAVLMEKASVPTAVALGVLVGLCEFPCTGGPYLMVLGLLHDNVTYYTGVSYLFLYNLIFILPLVLILLIASDKSLLAKVQAWQQSERKAMRWGGGIAMMALGVIVFAV
jgi:cytochrome c biogenesis protein CcdA